MLCELIKGRRLKVLQVLGESLFEDGISLGFKNRDASLKAFYTLMLNSVVEGWEVRQYYK